MAEAGGSLARWLAALNPEWEVPVPETGSAPETWRLGNAEQRRGYLATLRASDPAAARELLAASWDGADQAERAVFLSVLADGLGPADEPLLETALDDRAAEVRSRAAVLLAGLPGSALGRRMTERARRCLRIEHGPRGTRLVAVPPVESDASMRRDGIAPGPGRGARGWPTWTASWSRCWPGPRFTPGRTRSAGRPARSSPCPRATGRRYCSRAGRGPAIAQRDQDWTAALIGRALDHQLAGWPAVTPTVAEALKRLARRADPSLGAPGALAGPGPDAPPAVRNALNVLRFRHDMRSELEDGHCDG